MDEVIYTLVTITASLFEWTNGKLTFVFSTTRKRQNTILVKVPVQDESQEEQESGSETSDSVCNGSQSLNTPNGQNVTLITLNAEGTVI